MNLYRILTKNYQKPNKIFAKNKIVKKDLKMLVKKNINVASN